MSSHIFNVEKQLTFYGAYHANHTNIVIHMIFVPIIIWTFQVMLSSVGMPHWFPEVHYQVNDYMAFDLNWAAIQAALYLVYYFILEPVATILYIPQVAVSLLTATAFKDRPNALIIAGVLNVLSYIAQFVGHGVFEGRAPALLDNLLQANVLAPFFVHLEMLFSIGYRPKFHKRLTNEIGKEITRVRKANGDKKRAAEASKKGL
ncbi:hypothetical protein DL96DRAFT_365146 [Flagelloscypha sp. PMI_526]|nr:hypothetical protein DL96DRAFT_365146 [Flagelloscypha sp. PMI_526]